MTGKYEGITDHAIVRYLERVAGVNLDFIRDEILKDCAEGRELGATGVRIRTPVAAKYVLSKHTRAVLTILPRS